MSGAPRRAMSFVALAVPAASLTERNLTLSGSSRWSRIFKAPFLNISLGGIIGKKDRESKIENREEIFLQDSRFSILDLCVLRYRVEQVFQLLFRFTGYLHGLLAAFGAADDVHQLGGNLEELREVIPEQERSE